MMYDCVIVGGGPAGLTAAIYLARFCCNIILIDNNQSRAALIPKSHNYPGFPNGVSGIALLKKLRHQYEKYGTIKCDSVSSITKKKNYFIVKGKTYCYQTRFVIIATGVIDIEPQLPKITSAIKQGLIRHCLICDGYEARNKKIALLGFGKKCLTSAKLLKTYSPNVLYFNLGPPFKNNSDVTVITDEIIEVILQNKKIVGLKTKFQTYYVNTIYSALGVEVRSDIAIKLGVKHLQKGYLKVNAHQETNIKGVYAIGDVSEGLSQITTATSGAAIAATHIFHQIKINKE